MEKIKIIIESSYSVASMVFFDKCPETPAETDNLIEEAIVDYVDTVYHSHPIELNDVNEDQFYNSISYQLEYIVAEEDDEL